MVVRLIRHAIPCMIPRHSRMTIMIAAMRFVRTTRTTRRIHLSRLSSQPDDGIHLQELVEDHEINLSVVTQVTNRCVPEQGYKVV